MRAPILLIFATLTLTAGCDRSSTQDDHGEPE
jgi:hypothetical protein